MNYNQINDPERKKLLYLPKEYDLVVGDEFQLFYRGIIKSMHPYNYYIYVNCEKGRCFDRYFTYTPKEGEEGEYVLTIALYDDYMNLIEEGTTKLIVNKIEKPNIDRHLNILCIGDSLTCNGVWPSTGAERFENDETIEGEPKSYGLGECFNFIGTCERIVEYSGGRQKKIGYEGYGGWHWRHFVYDETVDPSSFVWVEYKNHPFTENDQHSVWLNENKKWVLETIVKDKLKFKRGEGNWGIAKAIGKEFKHYDGGIHKDDFTITDFEFERGNPFFDKTLGKIDLKKYCEKNHFEGIDYVYILLSWNNMYKQYSHNYTDHENYMNSLLGQIKEDYPNVKICLIGLQSPSIDGGITSSYGAHGLYSDTFGDLCSAHYYNKFLEEYASRDEHKDYMRYVDLMSQFDIENNMPKMERRVNARNPKMEILGSNGFHPTMIGYKQFGDAFFRALVRDMVDFNKNNK